jgi:hypothetical protein
MPSMVSGISWFFASLDSLSPIDNYWDMTTSMAKVASKYLKEQVWSNTPRVNEFVFVQNFASKRRLE